MHYPRWLLLYTRMIYKCPTRHTYTLDSTVRESEQIRVRHASQGECITRAFFLLTNSPRRHTKPPCFSGFFGGRIIPRFFPPSNITFPQLISVDLFRKVFSTTWLYILRWIGVLPPPLHTTPLLWSHNETLITLLISIIYSYLPG